MPKKTLGFCGALALTAPATAATTCDPGYYLENGTCHDCGSGYYCTGGTAPRVNCYDTIPATSPEPFLIRTVVEGDWNYQNASTPEQCVCDWWFSDDTRTQFQIETTCQNEPLKTTQYTKYDWCRTGYYATNPLGWYDWYTACEPCTNGPAHSHYTSYSTPSVMYAVESNCPWECDDGYGRVGDRCEPLCSTGVTHIRAGDATVPLFPVKYTSPALVVQTTGGVCYGNLSTGHGTGINITVAGTTYHLE